MKYNYSVDGSDDIPKINIKINYEDEIKNSKEDDDKKFDSGDRRRTRRYRKHRRHRFY
jgi:hypothetical protein